MCYLFTRLGHKMCQWKRFNLLLFCSLFIFDSISLRVSLRFINTQTNVNKKRIEGSNWTVNKQLIIIKYVHFTSYELNVNKQKQWTTAKRHIYINQLVQTLSIERMIQADWLLKSYFDQTKRSTLYIDAEHKHQPYSLENAHISKAYVFSL